jgi:hypothetical protein
MPNPTPQTAARDPRREQAGRLREMAKPLARRSEEYARQSIASDNVGFTGLARLEAEMGAIAAMDAAALLAGAAALEAVEAAREALRDIANDGVERSRDPRTVRAAAALARLEAL